MMNNNHGSKKIPDEFKKYIFYSHGSFAVKNARNSVLITFGRFRSVDIACAATNLLIKHDWDMFDVANDLVSLYDDEAYTFKVISNHLIFDLKFDSYDEAIEYLEINSKCNNYHNDIFSKKKRKPRYSNMIDNQVKNDLDITNEDIPNIYSKKNLFIVKYKPHGKEYGVFNSIDEAIVAKNLLVENNWHFSENVQMKFYGSYYWIFKVEYNKLLFIDKFESYEDAFDCLDLIKSNKYEYSEEIKKQILEIENNIFNNDIDLDNENINSKNRDTIYKKSTAQRKKPKTKNEKEKNANKPTYFHNKPKVNHKFSQDNIKIKKIEEFNKSYFQVDVENFKSDLHIIQFQDNALNDYYSISFSSNGKIKFSSNIQELKGFKYILKILNVHHWNLSKINNSSAIHYFNDSYYIIKSFNGKLIVSGSFDSYSEAEENIEFLCSYYSSKNFIPDNTKKYGDYYKYIGEHNGEIFEISYQESLESLKAIVDILKYYNWNPDELSDYDIYYYHGIYWEIDYFNHYIKLKGRFFSKEDAIKNKIN